MPQIYVAIVLLALSFQLAAQSKPGQELRIKGHVIGETAEQFLKSEPMFRNKLDECKAAPPLPYTVDEVKAMSAADFAALPNSMGFTYSRKKLIAMASEGKVPRPDKRKLSGCETVIGVFDNHGTGTVDCTLYDMLCGIDIPNWGFNDGRMVRLTYSVFGAYEVVRDDLAKRIGQLPIETAHEYQNGFGASWTRRRSEWLTKLYHASVSEEDSPMPEDHRPIMVIETREHYDSEQAKAKNKPSPLD